VSNLRPIGIGLAIHALDYQDRVVSARKFGDNLFVQIALNVD
jgi:hypothetical protein